MVDEGEQGGGRKRNADPKAKHKMKLKQTRHRTSAASVRFQADRSNGESRKNASLRNDAINNYC